MKEIISLISLFIIILNTNSFATYITIPTWSEIGTTEVNAEATAENFLNIESESAILIEQSTRANTL